MLFTAQVLYLLSNDRSLISTAAQLCSSPSTQCPSTVCVPGQTGFPNVHITPLAWIGHVPSPSPQLGLSRLATSPSDLKLYVHSRQPIPACVVLDLQRVNRALSSIHPYCVRLCVGFLALVLLQSKL